MALSVQALTSSEFKNCCARTYEDKALQFLVGPSLHPGGLGLTKRLAEKIRIFPGDTVLDVACGLGESAKFLTGEYGATVLGIDLSRKIVEAAKSAAPGLSTTFLVGDGELLPFRDNTFTNVVSECSMCLMQDYQGTLSEIFRILKPGGKIGMTDITTGEGLPSVLGDILMQFLCVSQKMQGLDGPEAFESAGFEQMELTDESKSLLELLESIKKRLFLAELLTATNKHSLTRHELETGKRLVALARDAVEQHRLGYMMTIARKPES